MKTIFYKIKRALRTIKYDLKLFSRTMKKTSKDMASDWNYLSLLTFEERKNWVSRVYDSNYKEQKFILFCQEVRRILES